MKVAKIGTPKRLTKPLAAARREERLEGQSKSPFPKDKHV
jgi:hypothetical protein